MRGTHDLKGEEMALRDIVYAPDPVLRRVCTPVQSVDAAVQALMDDMLETMYAANGIGLAANQIGETQRVIVIDVGRGEQDSAPVLMANPEIIATSDELSLYNEGCLSLPELYADIERPATVQLRYLDRNGARQTCTAEGILATCVQHEIDHLNGVLFVDYLSRVKRDMMMKKLKKSLSRDNES